ncbi:hypothetical protein PPYR_10786 [Photinus pyralis]|uniref:Peptidase M20 dimerisation domain-containing protein n=3 Tax=Photinus pyralis TaxID=7054 RepID=A0A5N4AH95_PHOPY|nr:cytosolic non-specific dipeptidase-like [Photinus pyralis]KAB0796725.1 hypothetical protein PPYR_10786 [Photinus pyralis]
MSLPAAYAELFKYIDSHSSEYIETLREAVAIQSVSASAERRQDTCRMVDWTAERLRNARCDVVIKDIGYEKLADGSEIPLPPVIFATLGSDKNKKTICIYGHLDVQPASVGDGWDSDPFTLTERDGKLYGRGATDDKGPVLCWIHAIEAYHAMGVEIPVNIKFVFESMEESASVGLEELLTQEKNTYFSDIDYVCVSDNYWVGTQTPSITYGLRGNCAFQVEVECAKQDLHSGVHGGTVHEAMADLIYLLDSLTDNEGNIPIPNFSKSVAPLTEEEKSLYDPITFDVNECRKTIGCNKLRHNEDKVQLLMHRWRYPALSIHGIEGAFSGSGSKTVIPKKVIGKFSIRIVPNQETDEVNEMVVAYLGDKWKERGSPNNFKVIVERSGKHWSEDPFHPHYTAAREATRHVYGVEPDLTREGGSIAIVADLKRVLQKNIVLLPVGTGDDGAHAENEKINIRNYIEGTKMFLAYMYEVAQI